MKPSLPQGTRDFGPDVVRKRNYILNTIRGIFERYGFQPLETPAMENMETLMGKYGDEGDKLIFKILNNGLDHSSKQEQARNDFEKILSGKNTSTITERALKYDLTIPFARYVAMNHGQLTFPFKRYQIQPVWRADRPQKGRYREFFQCDADVVGSRSLINETELAFIYHDVFTALGLKEYVLKINHRKILSALASVAGVTSNLTEVTVAIDKLDKISIEKVKEELSAKIPGDAIKKIEEYLLIGGSTEDKLLKAEELFGKNEQGAAGIHDLREVIKKCKQLSPGIHIEVDFTLARGLNYYTGIIYEAKAPAQVKMGSIGGGGRYDDLTGLFGVPDIPGVGISFGVDRIYDVLEEMKLFPNDLATTTRVLFFNMGEKESAIAFEHMQKIRNKGIAAELFHEFVKVDKQFKYAEKKNIPFVAIIGEDELKNDMCRIKNIQTGEQQSVSLDKLIDFSFL